MHRGSEAALSLDQRGKPLQSTLGSPVTQLKYLTADGKLGLTKIRTVQAPARRIAPQQRFNRDTEEALVSLLLMDEPQTAGRAGSAPVLHIPSERRGAFVLGTQRPICSELAAVLPAGSHRWSDTGWHRRAKGRNASAAPLPQRLFPASVIISKCCTLRILV